MVGVIQQEHNGLGRYVAGYSYQILGVPCLKLPLEHP